MVVHHQGPSLVVHTPAKLNLFLKILGKRPDGYHSLETVMVSVGLYDSLVFREIKSNQTLLNCHRCESLPTSGNEVYPVLSTGPDNLIVRAVQLLRKHTGCHEGVEIDLLKRIPMQAGMGGGSSDAAATLVGLNQLWGLELKSDSLHELAAQLGSDVNFFIDSPIAAICRGRGELVEPIRLPRSLAMVVVCPKTGLSTPDVFRQWSATIRESNAIQSSATRLKRGVWSTDDSIDNALERPAVQLNDDVRQTLDTLRHVTSGPVSMSGSGTACFAMCRSWIEAQKIARRLRSRGIGQVIPVRSRV